jgi:glyoxylate reductase
MKPSVFVTRRIPEAGLAVLEPHAEVEVWPEELPPPYAVLLDKIRMVEGVLCLLTDRIDTNLIQHAGPSLKVISQMAVGYDNIDVPAATARRISVGHTPGVLTETTADFAWALLMAAARRTVEADAYTRAGRWRTWHPTLLLGAEVNGATLGILGLGRIGQAVARRARGFNMRVLYHNRSRRPEAEQALGVAYAELDTLLRESDFVSLHAPLTAQTQHLIGEAQLKQMKPSAILINTARGPLVDPTALYHALQQHTIAGAALDVTDPEPLPNTSPLLTLDNVIIAPHIASATHHTRNLMATMAAHNLLAGVRGERLPHCVNPDIYAE